MGVREKYYSQIHSMVYLLSNEVPCAQCKHLKDDFQEDDCGGHKLDDEQLVLDVRVNLVVARQ